MLSLHLFLCLMASSSLDHLPEEIISQIVSHVSSNEALKSLALSCRRLNRLSTPRLYEYIDLFNHGEYMHGDTFPKLKPLAALLVHRPDLAQWVRRFRLDGVLTEGGMTISDGGDFDDAATRDDAGDSPDIPDTCLRGWHGALESPFKEAVKAASTSRAEAKQWFKHLSWKDHDDALLGLLLPYLPRLETLELDLNEGEYLQRLFERVGHRQRPFETWPALQHLRYVAFSNGTEKYGMSSNIFAAALCLPALRRIYCENMGSQDDEDGSPEAFRQQASRSANVTRLELENTVLHRHDMDHAVRIPKGLTTFLFNMGVGHQSYAPVDYTALRQALDQHQDTLETLWVGNMRCAYEEYFEDEVIEPFASFANFPKLKRLGLASIYLFGYNRDHDMAGNDEDSEDEDGPPKKWDDGPRRRLRGFLPPNLEILSIVFIHWQGGAHLIKALTDLILDRPASLKALRLEGTLVELDALPSWMRNLARVCRSEGVQLMVIDGGEPYIIPRDPNSGNALDWTDRQMWGMFESSASRDPGEQRGLSCAEQRVYSMEELMEVQS